METQNSSKKTQTQAKNPQKLKQLNSRKCNFNKMVEFWLKSVIYMENSSSKLNFLANSFGLFAKTWSNF